MVTYLGNGKLTWVRDGKLLLITLHTFLSNVKLPLLYEADDSDTGALKLPVLGRVQRRCARMFTCSFVTGVTNVQVVARRLLTALNEHKKKKKKNGWQKSYCGSTNHTKAVDSKKKYRGCRDKVVAYVTAREILQCLYIKVPQRRVSSVLARRNR